MFYELTFYWKGTKRIISMNKKNPHLKTFLGTYLLPEGEKKMQVNETELKLSKAGQTVLVEGNKEPKRDRFLF